MLSAPARSFAARSGPVHGYSCFTKLRVGARQASSSATKELQLRIYRYVVDVHGQLFLHNTVPKNLKSCFKNTQFLDFFFTRLRPNPASPTSHNADRIAAYDILSESTSEWPDDSRLTGDSTDTMQELAFKLGHKDGYEWISPCGVELNLIKTQDTPIVYRQLSAQGTLKYAGEMEQEFRPDMLTVDPDTGYVYHPSPTRRQARRNQQQQQKPVKYGRYSLLSSNLVLERLAEGLEIDADRFEHGDAGSIEWQGKRYPLGLLKKS